MGATTWQCYIQIHVLRCVIKELHCIFAVQYFTPVFLQYSKTCVKLTLSKRLKIGFQDQLLLNASQKHCRMLQGEHSRMLQGEHSAILSTFIKLPFVIKQIFVLSIFEWPFYTGFTVPYFIHGRAHEIMVLVSCVKPLFKKAWSAIQWDKKEQSDLGLHCLSERLLKHFGRQHKQTTFVEIGTLKVKNEIIHILWACAWKHQLILMHLIL